MRRVELYLCFLTLPRSAWRPGLLPGDGEALHPSCPRGCKQHALKAPRMNLREDTRVCRMITSIIFLPVEKRTRARIVRVHHQYTNHGIPARIKKVARRMRPYFSQCRLGKVTTLVQPSSST
ncbi:uncharacterized protein LOC135099947 [Scylla paramamosain]|uniref:uncharacterized protein LOC135099947 n=1 Tax=Scylla paramamosain TaxID=85552 RepID=UPI003083200E